MITVIKEFSSSTTGDTFTSQLQSGDVILFLLRRRDSASIDGPGPGEEGDFITITPAGGGDPIAWTLIDHPAGETDNNGYSFWNNPNYIPWTGPADSDEVTYYDEGAYLCYWPVDDVPRATYTIAIDPAAGSYAGDAFNRIEYGAILRNVDLANWPAYYNYAAHSYRIANPPPPVTGTTFPVTIPLSDVSAEADGGVFVSAFHGSGVLDNFGADAIPAEYGTLIAVGTHYPDGGDPLTQGAAAIAYLTGDLVATEPDWTLGEELWSTSAEMDGLLIAALPGSGDQTKTDTPDTPDPNKAPYLPIGHNAPNVATNTAPTDTITIPDIDQPPGGAENLYLLLRLSVETLDGTQATAATYGAQSLSRIGRVITGNDLEFVEIWGAAGITPSTGTDVVITFDDLQAGIVAAANFCWNVDQNYPIAGFASSTGSTSPHTIPISGSPYYLIFDAIAGDGTASYAPTPNGSPAITQEYDEPAPDGSNPSYDPTMRGSGGYADSQTSGTLSYTSEARVFAYGAIAMIPAGLPSDLPPFLDTDPNPDTPGDPPYSDPTDDPNAGDEAPATPAAIVTDCVFVGCTDIAIHGMIANRLSITGNEITDYGLQAIVLDRTDASLIANNLISEGEYSAIIVGGAWRVSVMDNHIQDCAQAESGTSYAIDLSNCRHATIRGNRIAARVITPDYAIRIDNYCQAVAVIDNDCRTGYTLDAIGDTGIDTYAARNLPETALADVLADYMQIADYDADADGIIDAAETVPWSGVTDAPTIPAALDDLGDVDAPSPADGDLLQYNDGAGTWEAANPLADYLSLAEWAEIKRQGFIDPAETGIAFDDSTYVFTLSDAGDGWTYYRQGYRFTITGDKTVTLSGSPPAAGHWFIYIDADDGTLSASQTAWTLTDGKVPVASVWWNSAATPKYHLADERHTALMDSRLQYYIHATIGVAPLTIPTLSGYTVAPASPATADNTLAISASALLDQDLRSDLDALSDPGGVSLDYVIFYRTNATTWTWEKSYTPYRYTAAGYIQYDNAGTMTQGASIKYYNTYLIMTNYAGAARYAFVPGRGEFASLATAQAEAVSAFTWTGLEIDEAVIAYRLTWQTNNAWSGALGKCRLAAEPQQIEISVATNASSGAGTDHNTLENLQGDGPEYYHLTAAQFAALGVGATALDDLTDVDTTGAGAGDVLTYNGATWEPGTPAGTGDMTKAEYDTDDNGIVDAAETVPWSGVTDAPTIPAALDDLTDVDAAAPDDGQALIWSDSANAWQPGDVQAGATTGATGTTTTTDAILNIVNGLIVEILPLSASIITDDASATLLDNADSIILEDA